jgi:hypothetical protein
MITLLGVVGQSQARSYRQDAKDVKNLKTLAPFAPLQ